jgi:hypothetical protein
MTPQAIPVLSMDYADTVGGPKKINYERGLHLEKGSTDQNP